MKYQCGKILWIGTILIVTSAALLSAQTAEEIIRRLEENQVHETAKTEGKMVIHDRFGTKTVTYVSYARGEEETLVEFTSKHERGQKILRTDDKIYLYYPDASELIRLQGSALRDSVMGSDMSYEDMTGGKGLLEDYHVELKGSEQVNGNECFKLVLTAKSRRVAYYQQTLWVDTEEYVTRKAHQFSRSGDLLKEMNIGEFIQIRGKTIPKHITVRDNLKRNSETAFILQSIEIGIPLPADIFSLEGLTW
jgi:outer membrane lipoprotein-sorting protein